MLNQTKDILNQLIFINQKIVTDSDNASLPGIKIILLEAAINSLNHNLNSGNVNSLRGLAKTLFLKQLTYLYALESDDANDFDFHACCIETAFKYILATLIERLYILDHRKQSTDSSVEFYTA